MAVKGVLHGRPFCICPTCICPTANPPRRRPLEDRHRPAGMTPLRNLRSKSGRDVLPNEDQKNAETTDVIGRCCCRHLGNGHTCQWRNLAGLSAQQRHVLMWHLLENGFTSFGSYTRSPNMLHADMRPNARRWHHGSGAHPAWFTRALTDWGWQRDVGITLTPSHPS